MGEELSQLEGKWVPLSREQGTPQPLPPGPGEPGPITPSHIASPGPPHGMHEHHMVVISWGFELGDRKGILAEGLWLPSILECPNPAVSHCHLMGSTASSRRQGGQFPAGFQRGTVGGRGQPVPSGLASPEGTPQPTQPSGHSPAL